MIRTMPNTGPAQCGSVRVRALALAVALSAAGLSGCGGGGSSDAGNTTVYNLQAFYSNLATTNRSITLTGTGSDGVTYKFVNQTVAKGTAVFAYDGSAGLASQLTSKLYLNGTLNSTSVDTAYYDASSLAYIGNASSDGSCETTNPAAAPPTAARQGTAGALYQSVTYASCTSTASRLQTSTVQWAVSAIDGYVFACENGSTLDAASGVTLTTSECYEIDSAGTIGTHARLSLSTPASSGAAAFSLVAKSY
jgi:hypothetical protein